MESERSRKQVRAEVNLKQLMAEYKQALQEANKAQAESQATRLGLSAEANSKVRIHDRAAFQLQTAKMLQNPVLTQTSRVFDSDEKKAYLMDDALSSRSNDDLKMN